MNWLKQLISTYEKGTHYDKLKEKKDELLLSYNQLKNKQEATEEELFFQATKIIKLTNQVQELQSKPEEEIRPLIDLNKALYRFKTSLPKSNYRHHVNGLNKPRQDIKSFLRYDPKNERLQQEINLIRSLYDTSNPTAIVEAVYKYYSYKEIVRYKKDEGELWLTYDETLERIDKNAGVDCFAGYEEIYTKNGLKRIDKIQEGDEVLSYDFKTKRYVYKPVIKHWSKGHLQINRVHLRNGQHFDVSEDHPMWVRTNQKYSTYEKIPLSKIDLTKWWKRKIPIVKQLPYSPVVPKYPKELYRVIGHYIAEGWTSGISTWSSGAELIDYIIPLLEQHNIKFSERYNANGVLQIRFKKCEFTDYLKTLGSGSFDMKLDDDLLNLPKEYLKELLYGMWLGDGTKNPTVSGKDWIYSTSSEQLAKDIQEIGLKLGHSYHVWKQECHGGVGTKPIWRITSNPNSYFRQDYGHDGISEVSISSIEKLDEVEMYDLTVADTHTVILKNGAILHQCEDLSILMHILIVELLRQANLEEHSERLFLTVAVTYAEVHCLNIWLHDDGYFYPVESTMDIKGTYKMKWKNTPLAFDSFYSKYIGLAQRTKSWVGSNAIRKNYGETNQ